MPHIFTAWLIYSFISVALMGVAALFPLFYLLAPALITAAQVSDSRQRSERKISLKRALMGFALYIILGFVILANLIWLVFPEDTLSGFIAQFHLNTRVYLNSFILFLPSVISGAFILSVVHPTAEFRRANGKRSALFWLTGLATILGILSVLGLAVLTGMAKNFGNAF